jgi:hypothetical protein
MEKDITTNYKFNKIGDSNYVNINTPYEFIPCGCACKVCEKHLEYLNGIKKIDLEKNT